MIRAEIHDASLGRGVTGLAGSRAGSRECRGPGVANPEFRGPDVANQGCCDPNAGIQEFRGQGAEIQECWDERLQGVATYLGRLQGQEAQCQGWDQLLVGKLDPPQDLL